MEWKKYFAAKNPVETVARVLARFSIYDIRENVTAVLFLILLPTLSKSRIWE